MNAFDKNNLLFRITRFLLAIFFITACYFEMITLFRTIRAFNHEGVSLTMWLTAAVGATLSFVSFRIINSAGKKSKPLEFYSDDNVLSRNFLIAPKWSRFLHLGIDGFASAVIFLPSAYYFDSFSFLLKIHALLGNAGTLWIIIILSQFIYYFLTEGILGNSPAKFLTGSMVIMRNGMKINFSAGAARTLARMVPFEPMSFLSRWGWHDAWTHTEVVKEDITTQLESVRFA